MLCQYTLVGRLFKESRVCGAEGWIKGIFDDDKVGAIDPAQSPDQSRTAPWPSNNPFALTTHPGDGQAHVPTSGQHISYCSKVTPFSSRQMFKCLKIKSALASGFHVLWGPTYYDLVYLFHFPLNCALPPFVCFRPTSPPLLLICTLLSSYPLHLLFPLLGTPLPPLFA